MFPSNAAQDMEASTSSINNFPSEKVTYEKLWTNAGNIKQKCSLEIWLPKAGMDEDDDRTSTRSISPETQQNEKKSILLPNNHSRRSSISKQNPNANAKLETTILNETLSKKNETIRPRIYHYADYIMDPSEDRPRSSKSVTTVKSDGTGSTKSVRRQHGRSRGRRQSASTTQSEEILRFTTVETTVHSKNPRTTMHPNDKRSQTKTSNPSMITELMHKYSLMKKNHSEAVQSRLQSEKPATDVKDNVQPAKGFYRIKIKGNQYMI